MSGGQQYRRAAASLFAERNTNRAAGGASPRAEHFEERRTWAVCPGQVAGAAALHSELWSPLGSANLSQGYRSSLPDCLRVIAYESEFLFRWHVAQSEEGVSTTRRLCVGSVKEEHLSAARQLWHFLWPAKHAVAGRIDHGERRSAICH